MTLRILRAPTLWLNQNPRPIVQIIPFVCKDWHIAVVDLCTKAMIYEVSYTSDYDADREETGVDTPYNEARNALDWSDWISISELIKHN